jgi:hypothetical protein
MKLNYIFQLCLFFLFIISCEVEPKAPVVIEKTISAQVSNIDNCETSVKSYELDGYVSIFPISDRFDYTAKSIFQNFTAGANGKYDMSITDGNFYFEAVNKQGVVIINGTFSLPEDLNKNGILILSRVDKGGYIAEKLSDGTQGKKIADVEITHTHEITGKSYVTMSDANGFYCIDLNPGRYRMEAKHKDYKDYDTQNGFNVFVLDDEANRTANVFLVKK